MQEGTEDDGARLVGVASSICLHSSGLDVPLILTGSGVVLAADSAGRLLVV
jgi:hypothetical protein